MASKSLPPHNPHNIFFKKHHSPQKNKLSSDSNPQYIFNFPQKVFIKNQYINLQNSTIRDNHKSFTTLDRLLQEYSKSLSPNTNYNLNIKRRYKNNKRQKSIKNFSCTQKNPSFFQENSNSKSVYNVKNQNNIEELMIKSKKLHIFKKQPKKNYDYLDNLFDDSLRDKETKPREIPFTNKTKYSLNPNIISKNGDPTNNSDSYRRSLSRNLEILTDRPIHSFIKNKAPKMTKKNTITVNDYQKSLSFLITNRVYEKIKKEDGKKMENFHEKEKNKEKEIVNIHFIQKNEKNDSSKLKKNPETAIQKRYSNLKNIINYRSSENTLFLDNMLNVKSNNIKVKTQKKQIKKSNINIKLLKFFKLWEKFSKKSIYLKNFEKLKSKNFLANSLISKEFKILLAEFSFAETINPIISNLDFNNISSNIMDSKQLLENELNNKVISFLNKMKKTIDYHGQNDVSLLNRSTRKTNEIFRKKRTYSLNLMQMPKVKLIKNEEKNKIALRNLLLHFFCRLFEELYQINLFLALSIIEKFYGANQLYFPGNFQIIDEKIIFNPLSGSFLNKINDTVASLKFDILKEIKIKEFIFFFSKILKFDLFEMVKKTKKITGAQNFQIALKQLHQKIFDNYKTINNFEIGLKNLKNNLSTSENTKNESLEQFLKYIIFFLNFKKDFYKFFDSNWNSSFFTLNKIDAFGQIFEKDLKNFNKVLMIKMPIFLEEYFKNIREEIKNFKNLYQSVNFAPITFKKREGLESILQEITKNSIFLAEILKLLADHTEQIHKTILDLNDETVKILEDIPLLLSEFDEHTIINLNLFEEKINTQLNEKKEHLDNFTKNFDEQFTKLEGSFLLNCELCFCQLKLKEAVLKNHEQDILHIINVYQEVMSNIPTLVSNSKNTVIEQIKSQVNHAWSLFTIIYEFWNKLNESFQKLSKTINIIFSNIKFEEVLKGLKDQEISFNLMMQDKNLIRFQSILLKSIIEIQSLLIKIQKLEFITYPYINEHYLNLIFDILSCEKEVMYLSEILKRPIEDKLPKITDILKIAQKEYTLKLIIEEIKISWQNNKFFEIEQTHFLTISNINSLVDDCDKDINQLEEKTKLEDNLYFSPTFLQFSHDTNNYLHNVKKKLKVWRKFQCKNYDICRYLNFAKLNNLDINEIFLLISDVQTILVSQGNEFLISSHIFNKKYYEIFNKIEKNFEELKNKIVESLQNCRILFPRFNFLNDNDLINFFLEDNHQNAKKPMISSVFPGASRLLIESEERTIGMLGSNEEFFKFDTGVIKNDVNLIEYLIEIEEEMKRSFGNSIINSINLFALHSLEEWIFDAPSQIILASLHMIVSHELYEMYKQTNSDVNNEDSSYESQISMNPEKKGSVILPEKKLIFHKNPKSEGVYFLKNKKDIEEMFGRNVDNNILGVDKFENLEILQQKSFRGLLLRLQFWVNQISKLLSQLKYNEIDYGIKEKKIKNVEKILLFIIYLKECVYEMYQKMITCQIEEYEFKKHLKILVEPQTNHLIAECGGWSGYIGKEYLGGNLRYPITPLSERYFVFICSSFREKSGTAFKTLKTNNTSMEIVQELANLCSIAIFSYHIMKDYDFRDLKRIISGSIYSNCWVIIEEFNNLQHEAIQIICREILILQQKYILAEINNESEINMKIIIKHSEENQEQDIKQNKTICSKISKDEFEIIKDDISNSELNSNYFKNFDSLEGEKAIINFQETNEEKNTIPSNTKKSTKKDIERVAHGLFITYNENISTLNELPTLKAQKIGNLQSCFRITNIVIPDYEILFQLYLFMEGFFSFKILAEKVNNFIVTLKNLLHEENIMINLSDIISIIKRSKLYLSQKDNLIDLNQKSQGVFYNDKEFNQENDIKQAELNAIAKELRCFLSKKIELNKIAIDKQFKNSKEILEKLLEKIFGPLKTNKLIEEQGINKRILEVYKSLNLEVKQKQIENILNLDLSMKYFKNTIIYGQPYTGKSTIIKVFLEFIQNLIEKFQNKKFKVFHLTSFLNVAQEKNDKIIKTEGEFWSILNSLSSENGEEIENYFIFSSDNNYNLEILNSIFQNNLSKESFSVNDRFNNLYFLSQSLNFIIETINLKDMPPSCISSFGKIYLSSQENEMISLKEIVEYECLKISQELKDVRAMQPKKLADFLSRKIIKIIINTNIFDEFFHKKRIVIQYLKFLPCFMKKFQDWEKKYFSNENLNLIEKNEFICSVALLEMMHIHFSYVYNSNAIDDIEVSLKFLMVTLMRSFPFNSLMKVCFENIKDNKFTDFYFDYEEMKYFSNTTNFSIDKIISYNNDQKIFWLSKTAFRLNSFVKFVSECSQSYKIFLFGEAGSGKSNFLHFFSKKILQIPIVKQREISRRIFKKTENSKFIIIIDEFHIDEEQEKFININNYIDFLENKKKIKSLALIETKDYKNKVISLLSGSRSLYYGLFYYYSFLGETSNLNLENIFEIIDSYFLKKYHDNFHSQYLKDLSSKLSLAVSEKSFSMNYFIQIIINLLESSYHIMLENPNNKEKSNIMMMSFIKMELENYEKVFNQLIFDILLNSISLNGNENGLMKKTFIEKEKNLLFTTLKNLSSNSELASKLEKMFENKKNSKNLQLLNKLQKCSYYPRMNFLIIDPNNNFLVDNFRVISEILQNKFHFYSYILTNTVDFFNEIPGILLRIFTNFQDNIEVFQNNILVFSVGNIFNNRENIVKIMKFIEDETEKIEIIEIVHKKLISLMNISNLGLILIEKIKKVIENLKFVLVAEENNEIKTEKYLFYQKIVKVFTPITFDELVSEFETPEFLKIRNFDLKNLLVYVNNKIKNNQINFPMVNYKINDDFLNYKREILFKRTFYQIYEKVSFKLHEKQMESLKIFENIQYFKKKVNKEDVNHITNENDFLSSSHKQIFIKNKEEENNQFKENITILEKDIDNQQTIKIQEANQIIKELSKFNQNIEVTDSNNKKHYDFVLNYKILQILAMLLKNTIDCLQETFDIFSIFSSQTILCEHLNQINLEKHLNSKLFVELTKRVELIIAEKTEMVKKSSKKTKEFNKLLVKFLVLQKDKFSLTNHQNQQIKNINSIYNKISLNEIAINFTKTNNQGKTTDSTNFNKKKEKSKNSIIKIPENLKDFSPDLLIYEKKIQKKLEKITQSLKNILLDSMLIALKIIYFGPFDFNYQKASIQDIFDKFFDEDTANISKFWLDNNDDSWSKHYKYLLQICDIYIENYKFFNSIPLHFIYELNFLFEVLKINNLCVWDPLNIFSSLTLSQSLPIFNEPLEIKNLNEFKNQNKCIIFHYRDSYLMNDNNVIKFLMQNYMILNLNKLNLKQSWLDINKQMLSIIIPDYLDFIEAAENKFLHNKLIMFMIKKKTRRHFARNIEQSLLGFKTNYCEQKMVLKKENYEILLKVENILNENQLFESYSNILSIIINSCGIFCSLVNGRMYSWKNFLFIIKSLLLKSMRDKKENKSESFETSNGSEIAINNKKKEIDFDEEFFYFHVLPNFFNVIISNIEFQLIDFFLVILSFAISVKKKNLTEEFYLLFLRKFLENKNCYEWRKKLKVIDINIEEHQNTLFSKCSKVSNREMIFSENFLKILKKNQNDYDFFSDIKRNIETNLTFNDKFILSILDGKSLDLKSNLLRFITEELTSIFEYSTDLLKFHEFIKAASWQKAFSIYSFPNINIINTICSIASYYSVNFQIFENEEIFLENASLENYKDNQSFASSSIILKTITDSIILGNWVMMIFYKFPKKLWDLIENLLETMRNENKMANSFRIILDLQNTEKRTIPSNFLSDQTIIYHIHDDNVDEMEGFNDIWANILNDRILPTDIAISKNETISEQLITRQTESSNFSMDEEISDISLERKILVTEQESLFDAINSFNPGY